MMTIQQPTPSRYISSFLKDDRLSHSSSFAHVPASVNKSGHNLETSEHYRLSSATVISANDFPADSLLGNTRLPLHLAFTVQDLRNQGREITVSFFCNNYIYIL